MDVRIKEFAVEMAIKNKGIELEVRDTRDQFLGDFVVTKTKLIWCEGRTARRNAKSITWEEFREFMNDRR